jgi:hypothetical protein
VRGCRWRLREIRIRQRGGSEWVERGACLGNRCVLFRCWRKRHRRIERIVLFLWREVNGMVIEL